MGEAGALVDLGCAGHIMTHPYGEPAPKAGELLSSSGFMFMADNLHVQELTIGIVMQIFNFSNPGC